MTAFEDGLWDRLANEHDADRVTLRVRTEARGKRPLAVGGGVTALGAAAAAAVIAFTATGAQPAYALTQNPNGSITVTINDLQTAIPQLNARFTALGINETVVPVEAGCQAKGVALLEYPQQPETGTNTLTFIPGQNDAGAGSTGVLAAKTLPNGDVATEEASVTGPAPSCVPPQVYTVTQSNG